MGARVRFHCQNRRKDGEEEHIPFKASNILKRISPNMTDLHQASKQASC